VKPFDYCPACATRLGPSDDGEGKQCSSCGLAWYRNSSPTTGCAIVSDGKALITKRAKDPEKGLFDIPGGFLHAGEDVLEGLRREVREELGIEIDVTIADLVQMVPHPYGEGGDYVLAMGFNARHASGEPRPADDVEEMRWVSLDELDELPFAWEHDKLLVRRALEEEQGRTT
jgi:NADH pyrophosphatase NudC (nudix superfamily)